MYNKMSMKASGQVQRNRTKSRETPTEDDEEEERATVFFFNFYNFHLIKIVIYIPVALSNYSGTSNFYVSKQARTSSETPVVDDATQPPPNSSPILVHPSRDAQSKCMLCTCLEGCTVQQRGMHTSCNNSGFQIS
jgi:hypothetical protein